MRIEIKNCNTMTITGEVKNLDCYAEIKKHVQQIVDSGEESITIEVIDSMMITSSIIGYFTKIIHADGIKFNMIVHSPRLYELLEDLNLVKMFNVTLVD